MMRSMCERTVIVSDLHLGNGGPYDIFAGEAALPALFDHLASRPTRVILNGDSIDFLLNEDPLTLEVTRAVGQAEAAVRSLPTAEVLRALGRLLTAGGEAVIRVGNHDAELVLP